VISFELFPPKTDEGEKNLLTRTLPELLALRPDYCSVTYGAGGGTRDKTLKIVETLQREHGLTTLAHLTCVNSTREQIAEVLAQWRSVGVRNILALRGDPTGNAGPFVAVDGGFEYAWQLVKFIRQQGDFGVGVAGFPEGHLACAAGKQADWDYLTAKIECGADFVITQLFFDNRDFFEFRDYLRGKGVRVPLVPGIIPILSAAQIEKFIALCGAQLPADLKRDLDRLRSDDQAAAQYGIDYATRQCRELLREGAPGIHFYTLNKAASTRAVLQNLGLA